MADYVVKGEVTSIKATSRASITVKTKNGANNYYTVEYCEERMIPQIDGVDIEAERKALWEDVNAECDNQCEEILKTFAINLKKLNTI